MILHLRLLLYIYCEKCGKRNTCNAAFKIPHIPECKCNFRSEVHRFERVALWNIIKEGLEFIKRQDNQK